MPSRTIPLSPAELAAISQRGKTLAEYHHAASGAGHALVASKPDTQNLRLFTLQKTESGWTVAIGRFSEDRKRFLIFCEASQTADPHKFSIRKHDPARDDAGFHFVRAKAIDLAAVDFQLVQQKRKYSVMALPAATGQIYVYVVPRQIYEGIYPLGGDIRYLVSEDGNTILERRPLHKNILEMRVTNSSPRLHTHAMTDVPEDTDVFHVLIRKPACQEIIVTEHHVYTIEVDGGISYTGETATLSMRL